MSEIWKPVPGFSRIQCSNRKRIKRDGCLTNAQQVLRQSRKKIYRLAFGAPWDHSLLARKSANPRMGERHRNRKLSNAAVHYIRHSDESLTALAKRFKVWRQTIWQVRTNKSWKHIK